MACKLAIHHYSLAIGIDAVKHYRPNKRPDFRGRFSNELTAERKVGPF